MATSVASAKRRAVAVDVLKVAARRARLSAPRVKRAEVRPRTNGAHRIGNGKSHMTHERASNSRTPASRSGLLAAFISLSTKGWQRTAPWPKMIRLRVRILAPSTVIATGTIW